MIVGFRAVTSSTSIPSFWRADGRKLVRKTSARSASDSTISRPSAVATSTPMERLPRLQTSHM